MPAPTTPSRKIIAEQFATDRQIFTNPRLKPSAAGRLQKDALDHTLNRIAALDAARDRAARAATGNASSRRDLERWQRAQLAASKKLTTAKVPVSDMKDKLVLMHVNNTDSQIEIYWIDIAKLKQPRHADLCRNYTVVFGEYTGQEVSYYDQISIPREEHLATVELSAWQRTKICLGTVNYLGLAQDAAAKALSTHLQSLRTTGLRSIPDDTAVASGCGDITSHANPAFGMHPPITASEFRTASVTRIDSARDTHNIAPSA
jgi:hypothetical protein